MKRRILAALLALVMVLSLLPATAMAVDDGICGRDAYWKFSRSTGTLTIYGSGPMYDYNNHGYYGEAPWYNVQIDVTSIVVEEGITSIGALAFWGLTDLVEVSLPESVTEIGVEAFSRCSKLEEIYLPDSITRMGNGVFSMCSALRKANLPSALNGVPNDLFSLCSHLTEIELHEGMEYLGSNAFEYTGITQFTLPESLTQIVNMTFAYCPMTEITIPANVDYLGSAIFYGCPNLESVTFTGDAPWFSEQTFKGTYGYDGMPAIIYYPPDNPTWTEDVMQNYGGNITWEPVHVHSFTTEVTAPTCTEQGYTTFTCSECGEVQLGEYVSATGHSFGTWEVTMEPDCISSGEEQAQCQVCGHWESRPVLPLGHEFADGFCGRCSMEQPRLNEVLRIAGADRIATSLQLADQLKAMLGLEKFNSVIVASALNFPDALTGSYLAAVKNAPILLTYDAAHAQVTQYIESNLAPGGTAYILGGESAVSADFVDGLTEKGIIAKRVAGEDRFGTNLEIMKEAGVRADQPVLIATALNFADSLSASATGLPMILVHGALREEQIEFLETTSKRFVIIGGFSAVSEELEAELSAIGTVGRLGGDGRYQTSVLVAQDFVQNPDDVVLAYARNFPDGLCGGPLAYALGAPLILTDNYDPSEADAYVDGFNTGIVVGGTGLISDETVDLIFDFAEEEVPDTPEEEPNPPEDSEHEHNPVTDAAVAPTCEEPGLTEGSHCADCGEVLVPQEEIPTIDHDLVPGIPYDESTCTNGYYNRYECSRCNYGCYMETPPLWHTTQEGTCDRCGCSIQTLEEGDVRVVYTQQAVQTCYESGSGQLHFTKVKPFCMITYNEETGETEVKVKYTYSLVSGMYKWIDAYFINEAGEKRYAGSTLHSDYQANPGLNYGYEYTAALPAGTWMLVIDDCNYM